MASSSYSESIEYSAQLLKRALPFMARQNTALHPISYAVWYEYVAGTNSDLTHEVDALTANGKSLDEMQTLDLYSRHVARLRADEAKQLQERFQEILKRMNSSAAEVDQRATAYGTALEDFGTEIAAASSPDVAQVGIDKVLGHTRQMQASVVALKQRLEESQREAEQLRSELSRSREQALLDGLTGLVNRRGFDEALRAQIESAEQQPAGLSIAVVDLDHFKRVNDTYGHAFGDLVLKAVAEILKNNVKGKDTAARYGGEEFVILMPDTPLDGARVLAEQVRTSVARCVVKRGAGEDSVGNFSVSLGVTRLHQGDTPESLFARADEALYVSKKRGRNCVTVLQ